MLTQPLPAVPERTQEALLLHLKRGGELTVADLVQLLSITSMAVRRHLTALQQDGLVESRVEKQSRGRPTFKYKLTEKSEALFPSGVQGLAIDLLDIVFEQSGSKGVMELLEKRNAKLAERLIARVENLPIADRVIEVAKIFSENGYMTESKPLEDGNFIIFQRHCAVHDLANQYRQICVLEPKLMEDLLGLKVTREKYMMKDDPVCARIWCTPSRKLSWSPAEVAFMSFKFARRLCALFSLTSCFVFAGSAFAAPLSEDKAGAEAADLLSRYLQVDTTNPPGNEKLGADYLAGLLKKEGIEAQIIPTGDATRACVYARLKGNGKKKGIVLLNHIDVVPAQAKDWKYPPFSGEVHDGEIWGRGALDMKSTGIAELEAMFQIKRSGVILDRDIVFLGTPDEEVGGEHGAGWVKRNRPDLVDGCEFLLNEGAAIEADSKGSVRYWGVDVAEKSVLWLKVTATGDASHGSMPVNESAPNKLVRALTKLVDSPTELSILPVVQKYFTALADIASEELKGAYRDLTTASKDPKQVDLLMHDKVKAAMLRNTVSLTVLRSGYKTNVIPAEASAELDCRLLPGVKSEDFIEHLKGVFKDENLKFEVLDWVTAMPSPEKSDLFDAIKKVADEESSVAKLKSPIPVVPVVVGWFTDTHWFRELGLIGYGFEPFETDDAHQASVHGKNERIQLTVLTKGVHRYEQILKNLSQ